jgi:hypothetical protein
MFFDNARMTSLHVRLVLGMLPRLPALLWRKWSRTDAAREPQHDAKGA